jgi:hypothetical protein
VPVAITSPIQIAAAGILLIALSFASPDGISIGIDTGTLRMHSKFPTCDEAKSSFLLKPRDAHVLSK